MTRVQHRFPARGHEHPLEDVLELAHVAGPGIADQPLQDFRIDGRRLATAPIRQPAEDGGGQLAYVLGAAPMQRRHSNLVHLQAVIEVFAKPAPCRRGREIHVCRGDETYVKGRLLPGAEALEGARRRGWRRSGREWPRTFRRSPERFRRRRRAWREMDARGPCRSKRARLLKRTPRDGRWMCSLPIPVDRHPREAERKPGIEVRGVRDALNLERRAFNPVTSAQFETSASNGGLPGDACRRPAKMPIGNRLDRPEQILFAAGSWIEDAAARHFPDGECW